MDPFGYWPDRAGIIGFSVEMSNNLVCHLFQSQMETLLEIDLTEQRLSAFL